MDYMKLGVSRARDTMNKGLGGPFGAVIVKDDQVVAVASNSVLGDCDPTAHAEVNAIRAAAKRLGTHDLSGCKLYTTCYPCPMCMSAAIWANIKDIEYGCSAEDAARIGFRDEFIYTFIKEDCGDEECLSIHRSEASIPDCQSLFDSYAAQSGQMY